MLPVDYTFMFWTPRDDEKIKIRFLKSRTALPSFSQHHIRIDDMNKWRIHPLEEDKPVPEQIEGHGKNI